MRMHSLDGSECEERAQPVGCLLFRADSSKAERRVNHSVLSLEERGHTHLSLGTCCFSLRVRCRKRTRLIRCGAPPVVTLVHGLLYMQRAACVARRVVVVFVAPHFNIEEKIDRAIRAMLLRSLVGGSLDGLLLGGLRAFATQPLKDYSLALKKAAEISSVDVEGPLPKEVGMLAGVPMETFKRPVSRCEHRQLMRTKSIVIGQCRPASSSRREARRSRASPRLFTSPRTVRSGESHSTPPGSESWHACAMRRRLIILTLDDNQVGEPAHRLDLDRGPAGERRPRLALLLHQGGGHGVLRQERMGVHSGHALQQDLDANQALQHIQ